MNGRFLEITQNNHTISYLIFDILFCKFYTFNIIKVHKALR